MASAASVSGGSLLASSAAACLRFLPFCFSGSKTLHARQACHNLKGLASCASLYGTLVLAWRHLAGRSALLPNHWLSQNSSKGFMGCADHLFAWPLVSAPFACSKRSGDSSPGGGLGVLRHMDCRLRSASFNLFRRRLHPGMRDVILTALGDTPHVQASLACRQK